MALVRQLRGELGRINSVRLFGPEESAGIVSFALGGVHPHDLGTILDEENVAIRAGHHCAQPLMDHLGVPATARTTSGFTAMKAILPPSWRVSSEPRGFLDERERTRTHGQAKARAGIRCRAARGNGRREAGAQARLLEGFLAEKPQGLDPGAPGGDLYEAVVAALKEIYDPEIPVNIYDLGLIYAVEVDDDAGVAVTMTLTTPHCPVAKSMPGEVDFGSPRCRACATAR